MLEHEKILSYMRSWGNKSGKSLLSKALVLLTAVFFLYLALRGLDWCEFIDTILRSRLGYLGLVCLWICWTQFLRGVRWWLLLRVEGPVPVVRVFWSTAAGQLVNNFVPGRAGDLFRAVYLCRNSSSSTSFALATTLAERIVDLATLTMIAIVGVGTIRNLPTAFVTAMWIVGAPALVGVLLLLVGPLLESAILARLQHRLVPAAVRTFLQENVPRFVMGLKALYEHGSFVPFVALTAFIWCSEAVGACLLAHGLTLALSLKHAFFLNSLIGLSTTISLAPGGLGLNQFLAVTAMPFLGFTRSQALAYIVIAQALFSVITSGLGGFALIKLGFGQGAASDAKSSAPPP